MIKKQWMGHNYGWNNTWLDRLPGNSSNLKRINRSTVTRPSMKFAALDASDKIFQYGKLNWDASGEFNKGEGGKEWNMT